MPPNPIAVWLLFLVGGGIAAWRWQALLAPVFQASAEPRFDHPGERLLGVLRAVGLHERLLKIRYSGILHAMLLSGFVVLFAAIVQDFGSGLFPGFSLAPIGGETWLALLEDIFAVIILAALGLAAWQRYFIRPARFKGSNTLDASIIYVLIACVVVCMLMEAACRIVAGAGLAERWRPVSQLIAAVLARAGLSGTAAATGAAAFYWAHLASVLGFLVYIPGSKHRHMFLAPFNVFFRSLRPKGVLPPPSQTPRPAPSPALPLSWKSMLDLAACTECGRCQAACPAYAAGLPLSPKLLVMDLRDELFEGGVAGPHRTLAGPVISEETLWACTTCGACMEVCPVHIEHVPKIVDLRRDLVEEGRLPPMLQEALSNLQRTGNSMGKPARMRARWTKGLPFKIPDARRQSVDVLWFVGDFASFDPRAQQVTRKLAEILNAAGVDFGILYEAEQNSGNDVRRVGDEGLYQMLAGSNIETLAGCRFHRIMTTDPHSLNALRQEYRGLGCNLDVIHHTQLLLELLEAGRLGPKPGEGKIVTYHDPCYLGRYNGGFDKPRRLIERLGYRLHEMGRCRENSFCCGAGGGRIWGDDTGVTERPSENRIKEALGLGDAGIFVVACPKDKVMYSAATQALDVEDRLPVRDIVELIELS
ncbi:MAG: (Fe-S)-binding protein [Acetobacteraceae bacterium]